MKGPPKAKKEDGTQLTTKIGGEKLVWVPVITIFC